MLTEGCPHKSSVLPPYKRTHKDKVDLLNAVERFINANKEALENLPEDRQLNKKFEAIHGRNKAIEDTIKRRDFSSAIENHAHTMAPEHFILQLNDAMKEETTSDEYLEWLLKMKNPP